MTGKIQMCLVVFEWLGTSRFLIGGLLSANGIRPWELASLGYACTSFLVLYLPSPHSPSFGPTQKCSNPSPPLHPVRFHSSACRRDMNMYEKTILEATTSSLVTPGKVEPSSHGPPRRRYAPAAGTLDSVQRMPWQNCWLGDILNVQAL
ncbi:unnamed protein product [Protopolystoma xenopodis]|uniref:Uncharacterized protein n=1 Tax=Protopolystoma xenopodis TaxID=117903 RepID=A0A3S5B9I7_9PLAT|nr:unnamed protein product [Protopolystoma xenopodis]